MDRLTLMETYATVVRLGSLSRAADVISVSRALVSRRIMQLEEHLGTNLLVRSTRKFILTEAGQNYYDFCVKTLGQIEEVEFGLRKRQVDLAGTLRIVAPGTFGMLYLGRAVDEFIQRYPEIRVSMNLSDIGAKSNDLLEGTVDVAFWLSDLETSSAITRRISYVSWTACASPSYLARSAPARTPADLTKHACLVHSWHAPDDIWHFRRERETAVRVHGPLVATNAFVLLEATLLGRGVSVLPTYVCHEQIRDGRLVKLFPDYEIMPVRPLHILFSNKKRLPSRIRLFVDFISGWLRAHGDHL